MRIPILAKQKITWLTLILLLVLGSGVGWQLFASGGDEINYNFLAVSKVGFFVWIGLYLSLGACILLSLDDLKRALKRDISAIVLLSFVVLSASWSKMPGYALYTALQFVFASCFAIMAGQQLTLRQAWSAAALALLIMIAGSLFLIFLFPHLGIVQATQNKGAWRGAYLEKNIFGTFLVFASAAALIGMLALRGWKLFAALVAWVMCLLILIPSRAMTALLIALSLPFIILILQTLRAHRRLAFSAFGFILLIASLAMFGGLLLSDDILDFIGKDTSLTGRDELWEYALRAIEQRPFGFGFGSFWDEAGAWGGVDLTRSIIWRPRSAHNVLLEATLQIGLLGAFLFMLFMLQSLYRAGRLAARLGCSIALWPALVLYVLLCFGAVETNMLIHQSVSSVLLFLVTSGVAKELEGSRTAEPSNTHRQLSGFGTSLRTSV
jgi:O-antigen ligase